MNVLSTASRHPAACVARAAAAISEILSVGLVGVSSHTSFARPPAAAKAFSSSPATVKSMNTNSRPYCGPAMRRKYLCVPPYTSSMQMMTSPALHVACKIATVADNPEPNATQCVARSTAATARSNAARVGFPVRAYSNPFPYEFAASLPINTPGEDWANVVASEIGTATAPVTASGSLPA